MVIVSKDKKTLVNFDNIAHLFIPEEGSFSNGKYKICYGNLAGSCSDLGEYKTEERAKEVLREIYCRYEHSQSLLSSKCITVQDFMGKDFIYEMPEE